MISSTHCIFQLPVKLPPQCPHALDTFDVCSGSRSDNCVSSAIFGSPCFWPCHGRLCASWWTSPTSSIRNDDALPVLQLPPNRPPHQRKPYLVTRSNNKQGLCLLYENIIYWLYNLSRKCWILFVMLTAIDLDENKAIIDMYRSNNIRKTIQNNPHECSLWLRWRTR